MIMEASEPEPDASFFTPWIDDRSFAPMLPMHSFQIDRPCHLPG
jgi:hypothetical protein